MRVILHREADQDLREAAEYYGRSSPKVAAEYLEAVERASQQIAEAPLRWPIEEGSRRRFKMRRFPYHIFYEVLETHVYVLAIKHHSRHPDYWKDRL